MRNAPERIVLVTGGSRGIGAAVAQRFADARTHVVVNYRGNAEDADIVARTIRTAGGSASTIAADISDAVESAAMLDTIGDRFGRLDALILNASVDAMRLNREAQRRLASMAMPMMPRGGRIVYVTSHQAHFFPYKAVPKGYTAIAASKRAGEATLRAMRPQFQHAGLHFSVVSGDTVDDSFAAAITHAVSTPNPSGMVYVGGPERLLTA